MHEFSLEDPIEELDEADLRSTLDEFMQKHEENVEAYEAVEAERDEFSETVEELEADVAEFSETQDALTAKFAEIVARDTPLFDAEEVADRFSLDELLVKADGLGVFSAPEAPEEEAEAESEGEETKFSEKPDRAPVTGEGAAKSTYKQDAEADVKAVLGGF
jgi:uncharacterized coiled-coil DUF342 family protein